MLVVHSARLTHHSILRRSLSFMWQVLRCCNSRSLMQNAAWFQLPFTLNVYINIAAKSLNRPQPLPNLRRNQCLWSDNRCEFAITFCEPRAWKVYIAVTSCRWALTARTARSTGRFTTCIRNFWRNSCREATAGCESNCELFLLDYSALSLPLCWQIHWM